MYIISLFVLFLNVFLISDLNHSETMYLASYTCKTQNCLCEVSNNSKISLYEEGDDIIIDRQLKSIYFQDDYYELNKSQINQIEKFMVSSKMYKNAMYWPFKITILSYFNDDPKGSEKRARAVQELIQIKNPSASFNLLLSKSIEENRVDIYLHAENNLTTIIKAIPADYYLIDASASMKEEIHSIRTLINLSLKPTSRIFVSMADGCKTNQRFDTIIPQGPTEIFNSYRMLLDKIEPGSSFVVITDLNSSIPVTENELQKIEDLGLKRNIEVTIIQ